jgi:hypothetical protein
MLLDGRGRFHSGMWGSSVGHILVVRRIFFFFNVNVGSNCGLLGLGLRRAEFALNDAAEVFGVFRIEDIALQYLRLYYGQQLIGIDPDLG